MATPGDIAKSAATSVIDGGTINFERIEDAFGVRTTDTARGQTNTALAAFLTQCLSPSSPFQARSQTTPPANPLGSSPPFRSGGKIEL